MYKPIMRALFCIMVLVFSAQAAVYKWKDEQGYVHYSDQPRDLAEPSETYDVKVGSQSDAEAIDAANKQLDRIKESNRLKAEERDKVASEKVKADEKAKQQLVQCEYFKSEIIILQKPRVYRTNEQGEEVFMDNDERASKLAELQKKQQQLCKK